MSEFKRENRYLVIKWRDAVSALGTRELEALQGLADAVSEYRKEAGKPALECVVVESDWSIYDRVWQLVEDLAAPKPEQHLTIGIAPIGTLAPAIMGGHWYRTEHGWKWNGHDGDGGTFPCPGGDWDGNLIAPKPEGGA